MPTPTREQRIAARHRANSAVAAKTAVSERRIAKAYAVDLATAHGRDPEVFAAEWDEDYDGAMVRLFTSINAAGVTTPASPVSAVSGRPVVAGTPTPDANGHGMTVPPSVTRASGRRVGAKRAVRARSRIAGESASPKQLPPIGVTPGPTQVTAPLNVTAGQVVSATTAQATATQRESQSGRLDRHHQPSVAGNANGAAIQAARRAADEAAQYAAQKARYGDGIA